jgi:hypothetical protein
MSTLVPPKRRSISEVLKLNFDTGSTVPSALLPSADTTPCSGRNIPVVVVRRASARIHQRSCKWARGKIFANFLGNDVHIGGGVVFHLPIDGLWVAQVYRVAATCIDKIVVSLAQRREGVNW